MQKKLSHAIRRYRIPQLMTTRSFEFINTPKNMMGLAAGPPVMELNFDMQRQVQDFWCWAATATSVSIFYNSGSVWTQCSVAGATVNSNCCMSPSPCNKPWYLNEALTQTGNFVSILSPLSFSDVESQLNAGNVIGCRIGWRDNGGHFVVIYGCRTDNGTNYYRIDDPAIGKSEATEAGFNSAYQTVGTWTHTFITKS